MKLYSLVFIPGRLSRGLWDQLNLASQFVDPSDQAQDDLLTIAPGEVGGPEIFCCNRLISLMVRRRQCTL
jgi:hypothetical protein